MKHKTISIHIVGVGGQGIGMLSETLIRAYDHAGFTVRGADTHGLAQRGGIVSSSLRIGPEVFSPLIEKGKADIVLALERTEALRSMVDLLREGGTLVYYDAYWQPLPVRLGEAEDVTTEKIREHAEARGILVLKVFDENLPDVRMQNMVLLSRALEMELLPGLKPDHVKSALTDLLPDTVLKANLSLLDADDG